MRQATATSLAWCILGAGAHVLDGAKLLECPVGSIGSRNREKYGCGIGSCKKRYDLKTIKQCLERCSKTQGCLAFTWAPKGGYHWRPHTTVCTLYDTRDSYTVWINKMIFCELETTAIDWLPCPKKSNQVGLIGFGRDECGIKCENGLTIKQCRKECCQDPTCVAINWAPAGALDTLPEFGSVPGKTYCSLHEENWPKDTAFLTRTRPQRTTVQIFCQTTKCDKSDGPRNKNGGDYHSLLDVSAVVNRSTTKADGCAGTALGQ